MISCVFENGNPSSLRHVVTDCLLVRDRQLLLVKRAKHLVEGGKWALVGGFIERDELIVDGLQREIIEESGWSAKNLTLLRINDSPNRRNDERQNVVFVYVATADKKVGEPDDEAEEVRWFSLDNLPSNDQIAFDHADYIALYKQYLAKKFPLPVLN